MAEQKIFISHSSADQFAGKLYTQLLADGYWVWMDSSLEPVKEWEPQIEDNLRKSKVLIALLSSNAVKSDWVKHEGSMAYALKQLIIPINIEDPRTYLSRDLPIWARKPQLHNMIDGSTQYANQYQELKDQLEKPLPIRQYLIQMLGPYQESGMLLDEVALSLIDQHYDKLQLNRWERKRRDLAIQLIQESRFKLEKYWIRYDKLNHAYRIARTEELELKQIVRSQHSAIKLREFLLIVILIAFVVELALATYFDYQWWLSF